MTQPTHAPAAAAATPPDSAWKPLRHRHFRTLWAASFASMVGSWTSDSAAAWLMTSLSSSPVHVALVQAAMTLPMLLLGLPSGALADIVERRRLMVGTQLWVALVAFVLFAVTLSGALTAGLLLALTFANGIGMAMRMPLIAAMTPELVPRPDLGRAMALHSASMNGSRILGPMIAGLALGWLGGAWIFLFYGVLSLAVAVWLLKLQSSERASSLPGERFVGAMRLGVQFARQTPQMMAVLIRSTAFGFFGIATMALLPLVARDRLDGDAGTYALLLSSMGLGAIGAVLLMPYVRRRVSRDRLVSGAIALQAVSMMVLAEATSRWLAVPASIIGGMAWVGVYNPLTVAAQISLPDWVRARGMAVYQATTMGGVTLGSVVWGQVAELSSIEAALVAAGAGGLLSLPLLWRYRVGGGRELDLRPANIAADFFSAQTIENDQGPVLVTMEYRIDPERAEEFNAVMAESRRWRLRMGAIYWGLFRDITDPGRFVEHFLVESWLDRLRQIERLTAEDIALRDRKAQFHLGNDPPLMTHLVMESLKR